MAVCRGWLFSGTQSPRLVLFVTVRGRLAPLIVGFALNHLIWALYWFAIIGPGIAGIIAIALRSRFGFIGPRLLYESHRMKSMK